MFQVVVSCNLKKTYSTYRFDAIQIGGINKISLLNTHPTNHHTLKCFYIPFNSPCRALKEYVGKLLFFIKYKTL